MESKCTIYFEDPFWVGLFERNDENGYSAARHVFGGEPGEAELYQFFLKYYYRLQFSAPVKTPVPDKAEVGYKRRQRQARRETQDNGVGTFAQRALQAAYEQNKTIHAENRKHEKEEQDALKFRQKQEKKKQKQRGR